ncbi:ethanolamine utilization cob(I)yrinic acid a,c-diamide adenosyltransferase EutT [Zhongshania borealis]|uniref:Ethanolamine utilization cob(I)yrinic acid a,c-diamide adenosyltransferase EutT n=2 Tax=Zhongshania borealis TaxID=889488 RepID=A0ABP7W712_9GAMM
MPSFITETWLRQTFGLAHGSEVALPNGCKFTPSASQLLSERKIRIQYTTDENRVFAEQEAAEEIDAAVLRVNPLTGGNRRPLNNCVLCNNHVEQKTELLTLLDDKQLVPKTHPRIGLRGKLDTLIAHTIVVQTQFEPEKKHPLLHQSLADLRSYMGKVLRSEVTEEPLLPISMGEMDAETLHAVSHQPLKYLGHDHLVPELSHGKNVALINLLRAVVREAELDAVRTFVNDSYLLTRGDIVQGLNRLSSALYVLMLMTFVSESTTSKSKDKVRLL